MLALRGAARIPVPVSQLLLEVFDVLGDCFDTRSNPVEALEPGCHFLHYCEAPFVDAWTGQIKFYLPEWRFWLIDSVRSESRDVLAVKESFGQIGRFAWLRKPDACQTPLAAHRAKRL